MCLELVSHFLVFQWLKYHTISLFSCFYFMPNLIDYIVITPLLQVNSFLRLDRTMYLELCSIKQLMFPNFLQYSCLHHVSLQIKEVIGSSRNSVRFTTQQTIILTTFEPTDVHQQTYYAATDQS